MERAIIGGGGIALCDVIVFAVGWAVGARSLGVLPTRRFALLPLVWALLLALLGIGRYYLDGSMAGHPVGVRHELLGDLPTVLILASTWLGSYRTRRKSRNQQQPNMALLPTPSAPLSCARSLVKLGVTLATSTARISSASYSTRSRNWRNSKRSPSRARSIRLVAP